MTQFLDGFVRARQMELRRATGRHVAEEPVIGRGARYRMGRRLVALGAHMMGPRAPVADIGNERIRRAA